MSDWWYVTIAYAVAWGGVALYAAALARRVVAARRLERRLREMVENDATASLVPGYPQHPQGAGWKAEGDRSACDVPPAP